MTKARHKALHSLSLEFLVVVVGILVALAVDDWRQGQQDLATEEHLLTSLVEDLLADSSDAALQDEATQAVALATERLLAAIDSQRSGTPPRVDAETISARLDRLIFLNEIEIARGTYSEMIATGSFRVVRNPDLRRAISRYYSLSARLVEIPRRQVDPRPDLEAALAEVGVAAGDSGDVPDLVPRLASRPAIAIHARRIRRYHTRARFTTVLLNRTRTALLAHVRSELERFR